MPSLPCCSCRPDTSQQRRHTAEPIRPGTRSVLRFAFASLAAIGFWTGLAAAALAQAPYAADRAEAESWAWEQIQQGKPADFNSRCGGELDPRKDDEPRWREDCRRVSAAFLTNVLARTGWRQDIPFSGVSIVGARIEGDIDLRYARLEHPFLIGQSRVENGVDLTGARSNSPVGLVRSQIAGSFSAGQFHGERALDLRGSTLKQDVSLEGATIGANLDLTEATFEGDVNAISLQVGGYLLAKSGIFKGLVLQDAKIGGTIGIESATFAGDFNAGSLQVGAHFVARSAKFKSVRLAAAKVVGIADMESATCAEDFDASALQVGAGWLLRSAKLNKVNMAGAKVTGDIGMEDVTVEDDMIAFSLQAGGLFMRAGQQAAAATFKGVDLGAAKIGGNFEVSGAGFGGYLEASAIQVGGSLVARSTHLKGASLKAAKVTGEVDLDGAMVDGDLVADSLQAGDYLLMRSAIARKISLIGANVARDFAIGGTVVADDADWNSLKVKGNLFLGKATFGALYLTSAQVDGRVFLDGEEYFQSVQLGQFTFAGGDWGARPLDTLGRIAAATKSGFNPRLYDTLAKSYFDAGQAETARAILIEKRNEEYKYSESMWWSAWLYIQWLFTRYGYFPLLGLTWIAGFAAVSAVIFKTGANTVVNYVKPRSWLVFSLDAVIPGIHLDKGFDDIRFSGKRQYLVYALRLLGALVIYLFLEALKQSITEPK